MKRMTGYSLGYAARSCGLRQKGYRIYLLQGEDDQTGVLIADGYDLKSILRLKPELRRCRIELEEDYYGIVILRVREARV